MYALTAVAAQTVKVIRCNRVARLIAAAAMSMVAAAALPDSASAQSTDDTPSRVVSVNPFIVLVGYFSGEYEQRLNNSFSIGIAGSSIKFSGLRKNVDAKIRLYPNEKALQGFGFGVSLGYTWMRAETEVFPDYRTCAERPEDCVVTSYWDNYSAPSAAIEISQQWLLGSRKHSAVIIGGGVKRVFARDDAWGGQQLITPTGRVSVGYAF